MPGTDIRFGVDTSDRFRSPTFLVTTPGADDDVYIMSRELGTRFKVSLHASGSWHFRLGTRTDDMQDTKWIRPAPFVSRLTKAFAVVIPRSAARVPLTDEYSRAPIHWYRVPSGAEGLQFTLIYSGPGALVSSWPGASAMSTTLVGRFDLPKSRETVWLLAHPLAELPTPRPFGEGPVNVTPAKGSVSGDELAETANTGNLQALLFGQADDGMGWIMAGGVEVARRTQEHGPHVE
jgi:hypothetical protein